MLSFFCTAGMAACMVLHLDNVKDYTCIQRSNDFYQCVRYPDEAQQGQRLQTLQETRYELFEFDR